MNHKAPRKHQDPKSTSHSSGHKKGWLEAGVGNDQSLVLGLKPKSDHK